ncbi:MAG: ABC transporter ATP-binding protein [Micromonosporaceae bacterium]
MAGVNLVSVSKAFGRQWAVRDLDLTVADGEFFSLLGPSGCGKTTTLRMVAGLEMPTSGQIMLDSTDVTATPPDSRNVNMVFQTYALFDHLTVWENVAFGLKRRTIPPTEIEARVDQILGLVRMREQARMRPQQLSGGQRQRVAIARALVNKPDVALLDEPLSALDHNLRMQMRGELREIHREVGCTFIYVTHDQEEALTMSDRIAIMNNGMIEQVGTPEDVYERPATAFVASFMGTSNLMAGTYAGGAVTLRRGLRFPVGLRRFADGTKVSVSIRPEKIRLWDFHPSMFTMEGELRNVVYSGATTLYVIGLARGIEIAAMVPNFAPVRREDRPALGQAVTFGWFPEHCLVIAGTLHPGASPDTGRHELASMAD